MESLNSNNIKALGSFSGVYRIQIKQHFYIGSSKNIAHRLNTHLKTLRTKTHHNHTMQNCYNKYGEEALQFCIVEQCAKEDCIKREQYYIKYLKPDMNHILDPVLIIRDVTYRKRLSESHKEYYKTHPQVNCKPVFKYDLRGTFICSYTSATEAARFCNLNNSSISTCCRGKSKKCGGFQWSYQQEEKPCLIKEKPKKERKLYIPKNRKTVYRYDLQGNFIDSFPCAKIAAQTLGIDSRAIGLVAGQSKTFYKSAGGFQWRYEYFSKIQGYQNGSAKARIKSIQVTDISIGIKTIYKSTADFIRALNIFKNFDSECANASYARRTKSLYLKRYKIEEYTERAREKFRESGKLLTEYAEDNPNPSFIEIY